MSMNLQVPQIGSQPRTGSRPFWSVMIPSYNRTAYLERTLRSVLCQDPGIGEMQIEVVDDASTTGDADLLVRRVCGDRVSFARQPRNIGGVANWNSCIERSFGEWVHILHSDDVVFPGFYERLRAALDGRNDVGAAFCRHALIDKDDRWLYTFEMETPQPEILTGFIEKIGVSQRIQFPSIVVRRAVYERLGGFRTDLSCAADWEMWIRIAAHYPIWYEPEILAAFRTHSSSWTDAVVKSGDSIAYEQRCIEINRPFLPPDRAEIISRKARELASLRALEYANRAVGNAEFKTAFNQTWGALKCSCSPRVIKALSLLFARIVRGGLRRACGISKKGLVRAGS